MSQIGSLLEALRHEFEAKYERGSKEAQAYELGKAAFAAGRKAVPVQDPKLMALLKANPGPMGSSVPMLDAWSKGWHEANLAAPLP